MYGINLFLWLYRLSQNFVKDNSFFGLFWTFLIQCWILIGVSFAITWKYFYIMYKYRNAKQDNKPFILYWCFSNQCSKFLKIQLTFGERQTVCWKSVYTWNSLNCWSRIFSRNISGIEDEWDFSPFLGVCLCRKNIFSHQKCKQTVFGCLNKNRRTNEVNFLLTLLP